MVIEVWHLKLRISTLVSKWTVKYTLFEFIIILREMKQVYVKKSYESRERWTAFGSFPNNTC